MAKRAETLLLVYNADSGPVALALDFAHRVTSPSTYPCRLCDLSYGYFTMKAEWKAFLATLPVPVTFLLKDVFARKHRAYVAEHDVAFPAGFLVRASGDLRQILTAAEIDEARTLAELEALVAAKLSATGVAAALETA